jgi:hypothetical protein
MKKWLWRSGLAFAITYGIFSWMGAFDPPTPEQVAARAVEQAKEACDSIGQDAALKTMVLRKYADERSQIQLDVQMGRRGDYRAAWDEVNSLDRQIKRLTDTVDERMKEYDAKGCDKGG